MVPDPTGKSSIPKKTDPARRLGKGQIIESINGETLRDVDPRVLLAELLGKAEARYGLMRLQIRGEGSGARLRCQRSISDRAVRPQGVVLPAPLRHENPCLVERVEEIAIEQLIAKTLDYYKIWLDSFQEVRSL
tara:strand:- start:1050 stop:1451 length:402 start_codon:yes stop_codon:yes gene_type:complete